ncbi:hypothetical protein BaRGS_00031646 [Batillaria attramentaria]|uniref:Uncharacterized protein n=1 Tax=Batillaria attramentaria TaxID=370345 RepID=A0ABD0JR67_9CAEN
MGVLVIFTLEVFGKSRFTKFLLPEVVNTFIQPAFEDAVQNIAFDSSSYRSHAGCKVFHFSWNDLSSAAVEPEWVLQLVQVLEVPVALVDAISLSAKIFAVSVTVDTNQSALSPRPSQLRHRLASQPCQMTTLCKFWGVFLRHGTSLNTTATVKKSGVAVSCQNTNSNRAQLRLAVVVEGKSLCMTHRLRSAIGGLGFVSDSCDETETSF